MYYVLNLKQLLLLLWLHFSTTKTCVARKNSYQTILETFSDNFQPKEKMSFCVGFIVCGRAF